MDLRSGGLDLERDGLELDRDRLNVQRDDLANRMTVAQNAEDRARAESGTTTP